MRCSKDSASPAFQRYCIQATRHQQREEFLVLEGECHIGTPRLSTGDLHVAAPWHEAFTTRTGVTVFISGEDPDPIQRQGA
jgi:hypothetical protein